MDVEQVRKLLIRAKTAEERTNVVRHAVQKGIPLWRVELLLDWVDQALSSSRMLDSLASGRHNDIGGAPDESNTGHGPTSELPDNPG